MKRSELKPGMVFTHANKWVFEFVIITFLPDAALIGVIGSNNRICHPFSRMYIRYNWFEDKKPVRIMGMKQIILDMVGRRFHWFIPQGVYRHYNSSFALLEAQEYIRLEIIDCFPDIQPGKYKLEIIYSRMGQEGLFVHKKLFDSKEESIHWFYEHFKLIRCDVKFHKY